MQYFRVANWETLQHYKDRNPPWIKLHNTLLDDYSFSLLNDQQRYHLLAIMMLASRTENKFPDDADWLKAKISASTKVSILPLIESGFLQYVEDNQHVTESPEVVGQVASKSLANRLPRDRGETEERESRAEQIVVVFDYWCKVMNKRNAKLSAKRKAKLVARFKEGYSTDDIKRAIDGCASSPFHMGKNDSNRVFDDIELICRDGIKLEQFRDSIGKHMSDSERRAQNIMGAQL